MSVRLESRSIQVIGHDTEHQNDSIMTDSLNEGITQRAAKKVCRIGSWLWAPVLLSQKKTPYISPSPT